MVQALLLALLHMGGTVSEERSAVLIIANTVALNAPIGFTLGVMALHGRSLLLPTVIHVSLDMVSRLVGG